MNGSHFSEPMEVSFIERKILRCVKGLSNGLYVLRATSRFDDQRSRTIFSKAFLHNNRALRAFKLAPAATRSNWTKNEKWCKELFKGRITKVAITNSQLLAVFMTTNIPMLFEGRCGFDRNELLKRFDQSPADSCRYTLYSDADIPELIAGVDISNECLLLWERAMVSAENFKIVSDDAEMLCITE